MKDLDVIKTVEEYLDQKDWRVKENSNVIYSYGGLNKYITGKMQAIYWLNKYYPEYIRRAHFNGDFHIHDLSQLSPYSYMGSECIRVKYNNEDMYVAFEDLYDILTEPEKLLNDKDNAFAKFPENLFISDKNGFTKVTRMIKKKSVRKFHFIKGSNGCSQIVTDNHPVITTFTKKNASDITDNDFLITTKIPESSDNKTFIYLGELLKNTNNLLINGVSVTDTNKLLDGNISIKGGSSSIKNKINLTKDFGYLYGILLAEGTIYKNSVSFTNKSIEIIQKATKWMTEMNIPFRLYEQDDGVYTINIKSQIFGYMMSDIFKFTSGAKIKKLPANFIQFNNNFLKGIIGGFLDGDGNLSYKHRQIVLRTVSRKLLNQFSYIIQKNGYTVRTHKPQLINMNKTGFKSNFILYGIQFTPYNDGENFESIKIDISMPMLSLREKGENTKGVFTFGYGDVKVNTNFDYNDITEDNVYDITTDTHTFYCGNILSHNCNGIDLEAILNEGINGVQGHIESTPPKHFSSAIDMASIMVINFQAEFAGAQGLSNFDLLMSAFIKRDFEMGRLRDYDDIKQIMQRFIFALNYPLRQGSEPAFSNITFDIFVPEEWAEKHPTIGGHHVDFKYKDCQKEMDMLNKAFYEIMIDGDANGRPFPYPIPTYNITKDFKWDDERYDLLFEMTGKNGTPYFQNLINSDLKPSDIRSFCCFTGNTEIIYKTDDKVSIRSLYDVFKSGKNIEVLSDGKWVSAKPIKIDYDRPFMKVTLRNGKSYTMTDNHINRTSRGDILAKDLVIGDALEYIINARHTFIKIMSIEQITNHDNVAYCVEIDKEFAPYFELSDGLYTHNCRLQLSLKELARKTGGLFGSNSRTGSIGNVTINLPRIAYLSKSKEEFLQRLETLMDTAKDSLEIKRKIINELLEKGLFPYTKRYVYHFKTFFSTMGIVGGHEACMNLLKVPISDPKGKQWMLEVINFMRDRLIKYQEETGNLYNLEASPAESTTFRFAKKDVEIYSDIYTSKDENGRVFYTNSTHLNVDYTDDPFVMLDHQDDLQRLYTGGTVNHLYLSKSINNPQKVKDIVRTVCENYKLPYFTFSPTYSVCSVHKRLDGEHFECPKCKEEINELEELLDNTIE